MPPHLNHLGNDLCRGLLLFKEARPLGPAGLKWLHVQVSNLMGNDKVSFEERVQFTKEHLHEVYDSADDPLNGRQWWLKADSPWQCLAACYELTAAMRSPDPCEYLSRLPIHQDGTCNGLQHYAALGGDALGARQVNMTPIDRPQDVYSGVAQKVQEITTQDALQGVAEAQLMQHRITRKLVKQTVMTNTYGVTFIGAKKQVMNRLKEAKASEKNLEPLTDDQLNACAIYITKKIFESMGFMFSGARGIQKWLNRTAALIARSIPPEDIPKDELELSEKLGEMGLFKGVSFGNEALAEAVGSQDTLLEASEDTLLSSVLKDQEEESLETVLDPKEPEYTSEADLVMDIAKRKPVFIPSEKRAPVKMTSVIWTTPLGLPVVQPYRNWKNQVVCDCHARLNVQVDTVLQSVSVQDPSIPSPVNPQKQSTAFPPNFIHSLDASHMMLSAIDCQRQGITYASVHDSYWTHACDVDTMASTLRDAFIRLHSEDIMGRLKSELEERYSTHRLLVKIEIKDAQQSEEIAQFLKSQGKRAHARRIKTVQAWVPLVLDMLPPRGSFSIDSVKDAPYFFH